MSEAVVILVVEDDALIRQILDEALSEGGFSVAQATSGEEAFAFLEGAAPGLQAVITDIDLASGASSGWDVARRAREIVADLPVIYMTGDGAQDWPSRGVPKSMLIQKPFAAGQMVAAVAQLINARSSKLGD